MSGNRSGCRGAITRRISGRERRAARGSVGLFLFAEPLEAIPDLPDTDPFFFAPDQAGENAE